MLAASSLPNDCARADLSLEAACTAAVPKRITAEPPAPPCRGHAAMKRPRLRKGNLPGLFTITVGEGVFEKPRGSSMRAFSFHIQMSFPEPKLSLSSLPQGWAATAGSQHTWQTRSSSERLRAFGGRWCFTLGGQKLLFRVPEGRRSLLVLSEDIVLAGRGTDSGDTDEIKDEQAPAPGVGGNGGLPWAHSAGQRCLGRGGTREEWVLLGHSPGNFLNLMQPEYQVRDYNLALC